MSLLTSPSLQQLISEVRVMLNQQDPTNSFWKDDELTNHLNEGVRIYFTEAVAANEGYFTAQADLDIVANVDTVALPSDFFKVRAVFKKMDTEYVLLPYRNNLTEGYSTQGGNSGNNYSPYYYFRGNNLVLRPGPNFSETSGLRIEYTQFPDTMVWGGDTMTAQVSPIFKQLIIMYAVHKAKIKESMVNGVSVHQVAEQNLASLYSVFRDAISERSKDPTYIIPYNPEF